MRYPNTIVRKQILTSGGRIHTLLYKQTGAGLVRVKHMKDKMGRFHIIPIRRTTVSRSAPSRRHIDISSEIGNGLKSLCVSKVGRGITLV